MATVQIGARAIYVEVNPEDKFKPIVDNIWKAILKLAATTGGIDGGSL